MKSLIILIRYYRESPFSPDTEKKEYNYNIPVGLAYISAYLKHYGHDVQFLNLNHLEGKVEDLIRERMSSEVFDFVITGGISPFYSDVKYCINCVRQISPSTRIIAGGGLISSQPEIMFGLLKPDFGVIGEGELTIRELFDCLKNNGDLTMVNGLIFSDKNGGIQKTGIRDPILNLDELPWPDYEGLGFS
ncbi:MAG: cobalamin-dependent protein, partial [Methanoregula sp.]|nr:cobalamin-dependent protein [Methanoregula sp.]